MSRPELSNVPAAEYYGEGGAESYNRSSRVQEIQRTMTLRALELLQLPKRQVAPGDAVVGDKAAGGPKDVSCHILDVGCGSGLSAEVLSEAGHTWVGCDIARPMLAICQGGDRDEDVNEAESESEEEDATDEGRSRQFHVPAGVRVDQYGRPIFGEAGEMSESDDGEGDDEGDDEGDSAMDGGIEERRAFRELVEIDMGLGMPFRPGSFDGVISISAVQWLCNAEKKGQVPQKRLRELFQTLFNCLRRGARAVFQFYPENAKQINMISQAAMKCGFGGGMVVDFPHSTRAKKYYLVLTAGAGGGNGNVAGGSSYVLPHPILATPSTPPQLIPLLEHQYVSRYACAAHNVLGLASGALGEDYYNNEGEDEEGWEDMEDEDDDDEEGDEEGDEEFEQALKARMAGMGQISMGGGSGTTAPANHRPIDARKVRVAGRVGGNKHAVAAAARKRVRGKDNRPVTGTKAWVMLKKAERRRRGLETSDDSKKYSLRSRRPRF